MEAIETAEVLVSDVTLREGNQRPGKSYSVAQKVRAGRALDRLGVDYIQAGFPIAGKTDKQAITELGEDVSADVVGLARAKPGDVEAASAAETDAVDIIIPASKKLLKHMLGKPRGRAWEMTEEAVSVAQDQGLEVHLTLVDAFRADPDVVRVAFDRFPNVSYITLADTVGARTPTAIHSVLRDLRGDIEFSRLGVHFHDDMGVATANALVAAKAGATKIDVSVASIGERAGNTALEEFVVAGRTSAEVNFALDSSKLIPECRDVLDALEESVSAEKSILGSDVFAHESGLHTATMLDDPSTFEPFDPELFGGNRILLFGDGTGRTAARRLLAYCDIEPTDNVVTEYLDLLSERGPVELDDALNIAKEHL
ncbi:LeuA family protein [Saliphagus sp. GCM10025334]